MRETLKSRLNGVENALGLYASSFAFMPAEVIYDSDKLANMEEVINNCHIYIIGYIPRMDFVDARQEERQLVMTFSVLGVNYDVFMEIPKGFEYGFLDGLHYLETKSGKRTWPSEALMQKLLSTQHDVVNFNVKYIGQAYGKDGSRSALDRLLKHETLQKISLKGVPSGYSLNLLLLEVQESAQLFSLFNPFAQNQEDGKERIKLGLDKLYSISDQEKVSLYEAAFIRYFLPEYNKEFKSSFPSTNLKILQDCYEKDFSTLVAEICIDELPFKLASESIEARQYHCANHELHKDEARKMFFGI